MAYIVWQADGVLPFGVRNMFAHHTLENRRIYSTVGVFSKKTTSIELRRVSSVELRQSVLGRLFHYGTIDVLTWSKNIPKISMTVKDPEKVMKTISRESEKATGRKNSGTYNRYKPNYHK